MLPVRPGLRRPASLMQPLTIFWSPDFLGHVVSPGHPESPARLESIVSRLQLDGTWDRADIVDPAPASLESLLQVHPENYIDRLQREIEAGAGSVDSADTEVSTGSWPAALKMAGAGMQAVDRVLSGQSKTAFVLGRPPGHHALRNSAMGFCLLANISLAAKHALTSHDIDRVMVIDWDVHHGNGTQAIFYESENLYFVSLHEHPLYPGTGREDETGSAGGRGFTRNYPLPAGGDDALYLRIMTSEITDLMQAYRPQLVLISAGFDAHNDDPLGHMHITSDGFGELTRHVKRLADEICDGRIVSFLEGGYNLDALADSVARHLTELAIPQITT